MIFFTISIRTIDGTLLGTTSPGQSQPKSNSNEGYSTLPKSPEL